MRKLSSKESWIANKINKAQLPKIMTVWKLRSTLGFMLETNMNLIYKGFKAITSKLPVPKNVIDFVYDHAN